MNRYAITAAITFGLAGLTACNPVPQVITYIDRQDISTPAVPVEAPPVQINDSYQCQTGPGPTCVPAPVVADAVVVEQQQTDPTQVGNAPQLP